MWSKVVIGGEHYRYYKHTKFRQNPRGDPKFLVDLTRNDPLCLITPWYKIHGHQMCPSLTDILDPVFCIMQV